MFEEITANAMQMLVQMFWLFLVVILVCGLAWSRMGHNPKPD